jgi:hypothetical protein
LSYIDHCFAIPEVEVVEVASESAPAPDFTPLEWSVIGLAQKDAMRSVRPRRILHRIVERLLGLASAQRLADPRLETLRRFAVLVRSRGLPQPEKELSRFLQAGFGARHVEILRRVASARPNPGASRRAT